MGPPPSPPSPCSHGDAHGDSTPNHPTPARSACAPTQIAQATSDPAASLADLLVHSFLAADGPVEGEIEGAQRHPSPEVTTMTMTPHRAPLPQVSEAVTVLLPELAEELQKQPEFKAPVASSGLKGASSAIAEDPLISDLIQRRNHQEIHQDPPAIGDIMGISVSNPQGSGKSRAGEPRYTQEEKGKGIESSKKKGHGQRSTQGTTMETHSERRAKLIQGESSSSRATGSIHFPTIQQHWEQKGIDQHHDLQRGSPQDCNRSAQLDEQGFQKVRPAYWWRKEKPHSSSAARTQPPTSEAQRFERYRAHVRGKCLNCFSQDHKVAECRNKSKCWKCLQWGHKAFTCPSWKAQFKRSEKQQNSSSAAPSYSSKPAETASAERRSYLQVAKGEMAAMASYPGDPRARPEQVVCTITATGTIKRKRDELVGSTAVCWLNGNSHDTDTHHVANALEEQLHISHHDIKVVKHFPEQYLVFFSDGRDLHRVLGCRGVRHHGRTFHFDEWTERRGAQESMLEFRVRLRIEGVPIHAWSEEVAAKVIGPHCSIHYTEGYSRHQDRTRTYDLWAWSSDPSKIAKKVLLSITHPDSDFDERPRGRKGKYDYKLHLHLDVVEDLSFHDGRGGGNRAPNRKPRREFLWNYGRPDSLGERRSGQRHDNYDTREYRPRRDRDDDYDDNNFNRGQRRHRSQSSWGRMTRCRGAIDDCYSTTTRQRADNYNHRSREGTHYKTAWRPKSSGKRVSFADPLVSYMGPPTKEQSIRSMLEGATGWLQVQSPRGEDQQPLSTVGAVGQLPRPFSKNTMEALQTLVDEGNRAKNKKKNRVAPTPSTDQPLPVM